jgi:hypothetical protein
VAVDLEGFSSGSMNEVLGGEAAGGPDDRPESVREHGPEPV